MFPGVEVSTVGEKVSGRIFFGAAGDYTYYCAIPGHRATMNGVVHVTGDTMTVDQAEAAAAASGGGSSRRVGRVGHVGRVGRVGLGHPDAQRAADRFHRGGQRTDPLAVGVDVHRHRRVERRQLDALAAEDVHVGMREMCSLEHLREVREELQAGERSDDGYVEQAVVVRRIRA